MSIKPPLNNQEIGRKVKANILVVRAFFIMHFPKKKNSLLEIQTIGNEIVVHSNVNREQNKGNNLVDSWPESTEHKTTIKYLTLSRREAIW